MTLGRFGLLIAASALSLVAFGAHVSGAPLRGLHLFGAFACVFFVYNLDHTAGGGEDKEHTGRVASVRRFRYPLSIATIAVPLAYAGLALALEPHSLFYGLPCVAGVFIYSLPTLPLGRYRRIKDIPLAKNVYVPALWTTLLMFSEPWRSSDALWLTWITLTSLFVFARIFIGVLANDLRDAHGDAAAGLVTSTHVLGPMTVIRLGDAINVASAGLLAALAYLRHEPILWLLWAGCIYSSRLMRALARATTTEEKEWVGEIWDFEYLAIGAVALLGERVG